MSETQKIMTGFVYGNKLLPQDVFDRTVWHLATQGGPSRFLTCRYRAGQNGDLRCAVGYWIPDDLYDSTIEGAPLVIISREKAVLNRKLERFLPVALMPYVPLLRDLQQAHDRASFEDGDTILAIRPKWLDPWIPLLNVRPEERVDGRVDSAGFRGGIASILVEVAKVWKLNSASVEKAFPR